MSTARKPPVPAPSKARMKPDCEAWGGAVSPQVRFDPPNQHAFSVFYVPGKVKIEGDDARTYPAGQDAKAAALVLAQEWIDAAEPEEIELMVTRTQACKVTVLAHGWCEAEEIAQQLVHDGQIGDRYWNLVGATADANGARPTGLVDSLWNAAAAIDTLGFMPAQRTTMEASRL